MSAPIPDFTDTSNTKYYTVKCIHKYKYRYRYMEILCSVQSQFNLSVDYLKSHFNWYMEIHVNSRYNTQTTELVLV